MPTKADIFMLAFGHLGIVCIGLDRIGPALDLKWTIALTATLRDRRWDFAVRRKAMSQMPDSMPGFHYAYAYPEDCCLPHCILPSGYHERDCMIHFFKVMRSLDGRYKVIATDASSAGLEYTCNSVEPAEFDPHFTDALSWRLAAEITASPLCDTHLHQESLRRYRDILKSAGTVTDDIPF